MASGEENEIKKLLREQLEKGASAIELRKGLIDAKIDEKLLDEVLNEKVSENAAKAGEGVAALGSVPETKPKAAASPAFLTLLAVLLGIAAVAHLAALAFALLGALSSMNNVSVLATQLASAFLLLMWGAAWAVVAYGMLQQNENALFLRF